VASLRIIGDDGSERVVELRDRKLQIGRGRDNDIVLPDSQKGVSRTHAELRFENGRYILVDLQSQNGTWLNGQRIERAEVPPDAEITVGEYRLRFQQTRPAQTTSSSTAHLPDPIDDIVIRERTAFLPEPVRPAAAAAPAPPPSRSWLPGAVLGAALVILVGVIAWMLASTTRRSAPAPAASTVSEPVSRPDAPPTPGADASGAPAPNDPVASAPRRSDSAAPSSGSKAPSTRRAPADRSAPEWTGTGLDAAADLSRVARKPGESTDAWRTRGAALHTRYAYSKQALDRHDYAAAAGGFEAILMEEPGFLDAPQLLVQANAGLRVSARDLYEAGNKLDAVGDWVGARQKYDQARLIHSGVPGLAAAITRVREKLQIAGTKAFNQARQYEASGRTVDAVKEYQKAFQWLPADDPNREVARTRVDQLKRDD
jgi:hypothetical protein